MSGVIIYQDKSLINDEPIVAIAPKKRSKNRKTGDMTQIWILSSVMNPLSAIKNNVDRGICGDCPHRGTTCYVEVWQAPMNIYGAFKRGNYQRLPEEKIPKYFAEKTVRFGAFGDVAALPFSLVAKIALSSKGWTSYTHQWKNPKFQNHQKFSMASVDSLAEKVEAERLGWRTFRIKGLSEKKVSGEIVCPASEERGKLKQCYECLLCSGIDGLGKKNITISIHGKPAKISQYNKRINLL